MLFKLINDANGKIITTDPSYSRFSLSLFLSASFIHWLIHRALLQAFNAYFIHGSSSTVPKWRCSECLHLNTISKTKYPREEEEEERQCCSEWKVIKLNQQQNNLGGEDEMVSQLYVLLCHLLTYVPSYLLEMSCCSSPLFLRPILICTQRSRRDQLDDVAREGEKKMYCFTLTVLLVAGWW